MFQLSKSFHWNPWPVQAGVSRLREGAQLCDHQSPFPWCPVALLELSHPSLIFPNLLPQISSLAALMSGGENQPQSWWRLTAAPGAWGQQHHPQDPETKRGFKTSEPHCSPEKKGIKNEASVLWVITGPWQMWSYQPLTGAANKDPLLFLLPRQGLMRTWDGSQTSRQRLWTFSSTAIYLGKTIHITSASLPSLDYALTQHINLPKYNNNNWRREKKKSWTIARNKLITISDSPAVQEQTAQVPCHPCHF